MKCTMSPAVKWWAEEAVKVFVPRFRVTGRVANAVEAPEPKFTEPEPAFTRMLVTVLASPAVPLTGKAPFSYRPSPGEVTDAAGLTREIMNCTGAALVSRWFGVGTMSSAVMNNWYFPS